MVTVTQTCEIHTCLESLDGWINIIDVNMTM